MNCQMIRVISSPSSSTTGLATLIFFMSQNSLKGTVVEAGRGEAADHNHASVPTQARAMDHRGTALDQLGLGLQHRLMRGSERRHQRIDAVDGLKQPARP